MLSTFHAVCMENWLPGKNDNVYEMMIMKYGRSANTVRTRNMPIKSGFKMWDLCDSGYTFSDIPHSNKHQWRDFGAFMDVLKFSAAVFAHLAKSLPRDCPVSNERMQYYVFMDNMFPNSLLFRMPQVDDIGAVGTARSNARGFPTELALRGKIPTMPTGATRDICQLRTAKCSHIHGLIMLQCRCS